MSETVLEQLCAAGDDFYARGDAFGGTGNLSVRVGDSVWITPTGSPLKGLSPAALARIGLDGTPQNENRASKEYPFHLALYAARPDARAVVHLHAPHSVAVSCLAALGQGDPLPAITPYYVMRVAPLGVVPYFRPGSPDLAAAVGEAARSHNCMLLSNHGLVTMGGSVGEAADRAIELEETARLFFLLRGHETRHLTEAEAEELRRVFVRA